jgi:hypothetical protein
MRRSSLPGGEVADWLVSSIGNVPDLSQLIRTSTLLRLPSGREPVFQ